MYLESLCHPASSFVTLTYSPEKLPAGGSLVPRDVQLFLKRLRFSYPSGIRFFACGEYGDETWRPHYHLVLFGVDAAHGAAVERSWSMGHVAVKEFAIEMAQYTAGYVVKKMTGKSDPRLLGRHPEFARMSNRPGIGAPAMEVLRDALFTPAGIAEFDRVGDVPHQLRMGVRSIPLGRYLRSRLRAEIGMPVGWINELKKNFQLERSAEVLGLLQAAITAGELAPSAQSAVVQENLGRIQSVEVRSTIRRGRTL